MKKCFYCREESEYEICVDCEALIDANDLASLPADAICRRIYRNVTNDILLSIELGRSFSPKTARRFIALRRAVRSGS